MAGLCLNAAADRTLDAGGSSAPRRPGRRKVYALGQWVTYRTRGDQVQQDAFFAPTTKTPYTDDDEIGYGVDLGQGMSFDATHWNRKTRDILEDYDLGLYADPG